MNYIEIHLTCPEWEGYGTLESARPVGNSEGKDHCIIETICEECDGSGEEIKGDFYYNLQQAKEEYPNAKNFIVIK